MTEFLLLVMFQERRRNPARKPGGFGAWVVVDVEVAREQPAISIERGFLALRSPRHYNRGSLCNPVNVALTRLCLDRIEREETIYFGEAAHA